MNKTEGLQRQPSKFMTILTENFGVPNTLGGAFANLPLVFPRAKIEYLTNPETTTLFPEFKRGKFTLSTGSQIDQISGVVMKMRFARVFWPKPYVPSNVPPKAICKSNNGLNPDPDIEAPRCSSCVKVGKTNIPETIGTGQYQVVCPAALWTGKAHKPDCNEIYSLLFWDTNLNSPIIFDVKTTGVRFLRNLKNSFISTARDRMYPGLPVNVCSRVIVNILDKGTYFVPFFRLGDRIDKPDAVEFAKFADDLSGIFQTVDVTADDIPDDPTESEQ